ncbi:alanine racemase [Castellaniella caeni]|uniref:alanine racemase n=1 Tax=Castellaniella caeni TaxID=266123 RepID=UPI00083652A8|nr:alanine racemase [Castellaniella caeni]
MSRPILAVVHPRALAHNLAQVSKHVASEKARAAVHVWAVVKANGYGHGLDAAVRGFAAADGLALLEVPEAVRCRELGWQRPILLLEGFFKPGDIDVLARYHISTVVHSHAQLAMLEAASAHAPIAAHVMLNSGMHRLGFQPGEYAAAFARAQALLAAGKLSVVGKMTHFARADDDLAVTRAQLDCFARVTAGLPGPVSVCNSAAVLSPGLVAAVPGDEQWVRPGICLYGASPYVGRDATALNLRPAMTLHSEIISTHVLPAGEAIGYGYAFRTDHDMRVGIVACGYADGYPRHAITGTPVTVAGVRTRLVGRVSMDMLSVDLDPVPLADIGSRVILWGEGGPSVDEISWSSSTIANDLLAGLTHRVPRRVDVAD